MFVFEHRVRRRDGVYRLFSIRVVPLTDDSGAIREWVGVHTDITEERKLIQERTTSLAREQEARQTAVLRERGPVQSCLISALWSEMVEALTHAKSRKGRARQDLPLRQPLRLDVEKAAVRGYGK